VPDNAVPGWLRADPPPLARVAATPSVASGCLSVLVRILDAFTRIAACFAILAAAGYLFAAIGVALLPADRSYSHERRELWRAV
jgi:hypothetical protein